MADEIERIRTAPVQPARGHPFPTRIPWHFHERAWSMYAAAGHGSQSAERLAQRGGFGVLELVACLALGDYHVDYKRITGKHVASVRGEIEEWTSGTATLLARIGELDGLHREACEHVRRLHHTLRPEVLAFAHLMETKLREHDDRPGWKQDDPEALMARLIEEANELHDALADWKGEMTESGISGIDAGRGGRVYRVDELGRVAAWEAVDVANFAMMIADVLGALTAEAPAEPDSRSTTTDDRKAE